MLNRIVALSALAFLAFAPAALADTASSQITSPSDPVHTFWGATMAVGDQVTVDGTATGVTNVDLLCYPGSGNPPITIAGNVPVTGGSFSATVDLTVSSEGCILHAVPHGQVPTGSALDAFTGPRVVPTTYDGSWTTPSGAQYDYEYMQQGTRGYFSLDSAGDQGASWSTLADPATLANAPNSLAANVFGLYFGDYGEAPPTRSEIEVDGASAYTPYGAVWVSNTPHFSTPGIPSASVILENFDAATGNSTFVVSEPIVKCSPQTDWASNNNNFSTSCTHFVPTGVILERTIDLGADGRTLGVSDSWRSPGSQSHQIDVLYDNRFNGNNAGPPTYAFLPTSGFKFPGDSAFQDYAFNSTVALPQGPGTFFYKTDRASPDSGGDGLPQGALSYSVTPDTFHFIGSDFDDTPPEWTMGYVRTVPARGATTLSFQLAQAVGQSDLQALAGSFESQYRTPAAPGAAAPPRSRPAGRPLSRRPPWPPRASSAAPFARAGRGRASWSRRASWAPARPDPAAAPSCSSPSWAARR